LEEDLELLPTKQPVVCSVQLHNSRLEELNLNKEVASLELQPLNQQLFQLKVLPTRLTG